MKALLAVLALAVLLTGPPEFAGDAGLAEHWLGGREVDVTMRSAAVGGEVTTRLLLPPDWSRDATRTWPVLYLLHGSGDDHAAWTDHTDVAALTSTVEAIIVMPDGGRCGNYSDWWNQGRGGGPAWETFHLTELRRILETRYHAGNRRAVAGNSMGGMGAMHYAATHPDLFQAAAAYSGAVDPLTYPKATESMWLLCPGTDWHNLWGDPTRPNEVGMWLAHSPARDVSGLRGKTLFISSGDGDSVEQVVRAESKVLVDRLRDAGIPVTTEFYSGGQHAWPYWQRELRRSLPALLNAIGAGTMAR
ncbi:alpha/beta hydrolase [Kutzneria kofuensis]|uniref:S-formylglutathione hydrolase FrmB n=1 Tax=Kutzneria kofuensis TaxID=103725 RepID=A0A7W9NHT1_9PSEU|nr:alpha/beta hydrolase family protein [Kutzneria kofuensis]MBB5893120.1 S-formylglutathione hydrolase FrmB [Kutzneria kofuensis]